MFEKIHHYRDKRGSFSMPGKPVRSKTWFSWGNHNLAWLLLNFRRLFMAGLHYDATAANLEKKSHRHAIESTILSISSNFVDSFPYTRADSVDKNILVRKLGKQINIENNRYMSL